MPPRCTSGHQALEVIIRSPGAMVDDVVFQCPTSPGIRLLSLWIA